MPSHICSIYRTLRSLAHVLIHFKFAILASAGIAYIQLEPCSLHENDIKD